jgi:hypothetical protein
MAISGNNKSVRVLPSKTGILILNFSA